MEKYDYIVNPDDVEINFWGNTYIVLLTRFGISFLVNAEYEGAALDEVMDFIVGRTKNNVENLSGLYQDYSDEDEERFISAGNENWQFATENIRIIKK